MKPLLLNRTNERTLPASYTGDVFIWDIDKTYLDTRFSSVGGLLGILAESAVDKRAIGGAVPLLRALRRGPHKEPTVAPVYFVSGSPPQLRSIVERKMLLDGVEFDGITFKDQWGLLKQGRPKAIKEQVGYKLCALLLYRKEIPLQTHWFLFGDDLESDPEVFSLFGEVCAGLRGPRLAERLNRMHAQRQEAEAAVELADQLPVSSNPVERIFIRNEKRKDLAASAWPDRVVPVKSFLQAALVLRVLGRITGDAVGSVAKDMRRKLVSDTLVEAHLLDAAERLQVPADVLALARQ